jgi:preprotein translocase subunit SecY
VQAVIISQTFFKSMAAEGVIPGYGFGFTVLAVTGITAGTIFLMWIGEQIQAHGIGNGISLLITANIVADVPAAFLSIIRKANEDRTYILTAAVLALVYVGVVIGVVYMTKSQRRIPIQQQRLNRGGRMYGGQRHYLPVKLNMANVMPVIFASALLMLPMTILGAITGSRDTLLSPGGWWWIVLEVALIIFFSYFWTSLMFQPTEMANNLKEYGSFIPGIRPGKKTAEFLNHVMVRITLIGGVLLAAISVIPTITSQAMKIDWIVAQFLGGTGILIVVGVTLDLVDQLNSSLLQRNYEGFMSAASSRRGARR